jgi:type IV conjugative transfer system protein TraL
MAMNDASLDIPRRLNDAPRMFWWEIDVALIFLGSVLAGMVAGFFMTGCALGVLLAWSLRQGQVGRTPRLCAAPAVLAPAGANLRAQAHSTLAPAATAGLG